jgi:CRP/FNR family cyclic AMP-dependent transcriptional regulator
MTAHRRQPLLDLDPDLGPLLSDERRRGALRDLDVEVRVIEAGPWDVAQLEAPHPGHVGLLLIDGVVSREVLVSDTVSTELLGPGDVMRMWSLHEGTPLLRLRIRWTCLTESRVGILDRRFGARLVHWPEVNAALIDRLNDRAQRLATTQAISQLTRVDRRLLALFWHLAERWGRVTGDGVVIPLVLSHRVLGQLVGARRQTVSSALGDLSRRGELLRRNDDAWLLTGEPTGVPTAEAQRVVPVRRSLYAAEPAVAAPPPARGEQLREACERLQRESHERLLVLQALTDESRRLQTLTSSSRRQREHARRRPRPSPNGAPGVG